MVHKLSKLRDKKGAKALLPHKLPQKEFNSLLKVAMEIINNDGCPENDERGDGSITFCVISILSHQQKTTELDVSLDDMAKYVHMYSFELSFEDLRRQGLKIRKPTLSNIFDEKRFDKIRNSAFSEDYLKDVAVDSEWVN